MVSEQRIEFDFNRLLRLYSGGPMDAGRGAGSQPNKVRKLVLNTVLEFVRDTLEESGRYSEVKELPATNGDDTAVLYLFDGPGLSETDANVILQNHLIEALNFLDDEDFRGRSDNPSHSGLSLGSVALGAALGAAAMHFSMKPKQ